MTLVDRATMYDLTMENGEEVHGRCGEPDGKCPCADSTFNRWHSGYLTDEDKEDLREFGFAIEEKTAEYKGHPKFQ
jgi:hypothetical protein